jgi:hypothetical protein
VPLGAAQRPGARSGVAVRDGVGVAVAVGSGVRVGDGVAVCVGVAVEVGRGAAVAVWVGASVAVCVGVTARTSPLQRTIGRYKLYWNVADVSERIDFCWVESVPPGVQEGDAEGMGGKPSASVARAD